MGTKRPYAPEAGHDINSIAVAGVLDGSVARGEAPVAPLNYIGDFGGDQCSSCSECSQPCSNAAALVEAKSSTPPCWTGRSRSTQATTPCSRWAGTSASGTICSREQLLTTTCTVCDGNGCRSRSTSQFLRGSRGSARGLPSHLGRPVRRDSMAGAQAAVRRHVPTTDTARNGACYRRTPTAVSPPSSTSSQPLSAPPKPARGDLVTHFACSSRRQLRGPTAPLARSDLPPPLGGRHAC